MQSSFSLPKDSWEQIKKIIQGYWAATQKGDTSLNSVAERAVLNPAIVSRNNKFLKSVGIISDTAPPSITDIGENLAQALSHGLPEMIKKEVSEIAKESEFLTKILDAVRIRKSMPSGNLKSHIALTAGAAKTPKTMQSAKAVIDFLVEGGLLKEDGDNFLLSDGIPSKDEKPESILVAEPSSVLHGGAEVIRKTYPQIELLIKLNLTGDEVKENPQRMAQAIKEFLEELKKPSTEKEPTEL